MSEVLAGDSTEPTTLAAAVASLRAEMLPVVLTMTVNLPFIINALGEDCVRWRKLEGRRAETPLERTEYINTSIAECNKTKID